MTQDNQKKRAIAQRLAQLPEEPRQQLVAKLTAQGIDIWQLPIVPTSEPDSLRPLSFAQQRLWVIDQLEQGSGSYNLFFGLQFHGELALDALQTAFNQVLARHEVLRTEIVEQDAVPYQRCRHFAPVTLDIEALAPAQCPNDVERALLKQAQAQSAKPFDLGQDLPFRMKLVQVTPYRHVALFTIHHMVFDAWSIDNLVLELSQFYQAAVTGTEAQVPELDIQYADFAAWQRSWTQSQAYQQQVAYWQQQLKGAPEQLRLSIEKPQLRDAVLSDDAQNNEDKHHPVANGKELSIQLDSDLSQGLKQLAQEQGTTLYVALLAAFNLLLQRYSDSRDICVGTSIANRPRLETEALLGYFVNTLVMRNRSEPGMNFTDFLQSVHQVATDAYAHQDLPFDHLLEVLEVKRERARSPLFQVLFVLNNAAGQREFSLPGLSISGFDKPIQQARFDMSLRITENQEVGDIRCDMEFNTQLYSDTAIAALLSHYDGLLQQIVKAPNKPLHQYQLLSLAQQRSLLPAVTTAPPQPTVMALWQQQVTNHPTGLALMASLDEKAPQLELTYQQFALRVEVLAQHLLEFADASKQGSKQVNQQGLVGQRIAIMMPRSSAFIISLFAVMRAGGCYVPIDSQWPAKRIENVLVDCQPSAVLTLNSQLFQLPETTLPVTCVDPYLQCDSNSTCEVKEGLFPAVSASDPAYMIYTSGSTGKPKGVVVQHGQLSAYCQGVTTRIAADASESLRFASVSTVAADLGNTAVFGALCFGGTLFLPDTETAFDPDAVADYLYQHQVQVLKIVPSHLEGLLAAAKPQHILPSELLILGGEACSWGLIQRIRALAPTLRILNHYGPTETTVGALTFEVPQADGVNQWQALSATVPVGTALEGYRCYVLDPELNLCPEGIAGELYIGGAGVAQGYFNNEALTRNRFARISIAGTEPQVLYRTGDKVRLLTAPTRVLASQTAEEPENTQHQVVEFLGRLDEQVKIRGYRVELGDIESALKALPGVSAAAVLWLPNNGQDNTSANKLLAWLVAQEPESAQKQAWIQQLAQVLPDYMLPQEYHCLAALPLTANGKLDRQALQQMALELTHKQDEHPTSRAPETPQEQLLAQIWCELLKREKVGIDDNFFALGGDSILSLQVIAKCKKAGYKLLPKQLFDTPTIAQLATCLKPVKAQQQRIGKAPADADIPLSFSQQRLWFLQELQGPNSIYNMPMAVQIDGPLNRQWLEQSFAQIVTRHPGLLTRFVAKQGRPLQILVDPDTFAVQWQDMQEVDADTRERQALMQVSQFAQHPFLIHQSGLFRVKVLQLAEQRHWLLVNCHHIIADGWSLGILVNEFCQTYAALANPNQGTAAIVPPLAKLKSGIQFADYAYWQHHTGANHYQQQLTYWQSQLANSPVLLDLPKDHARPLTQSYKGDFIALTVSSALTQQLKALAQSHGTTLYTLLMAAWQVLLHRYSGQQDICVGTPIANRHYPETQNIVGFFANTLVIRGRLEDNPSFADFLAQMKEVMSAAQANQDVPFEHLVDQLKVPRDTAYSPLFQAMFSWGVTQNSIQTSIDLGQGELQLAHLDNSQKWLNTHSAKCDIELALREIGDAMEGRLEFATDLFNLTRIETLWQHMLQLLSSIVAAPEMSVGALPLMAESSMEEDNAPLISRGSALDYSAYQGFEGLLTQQARVHPEAVAVSFKDESLCYQTLEARANQLAHHLIAQGTKPDDCIVVCQRRSLNMMLNLLAIQKAGAAYVPVDPSYPVDRVQHMLSDANAKWLLTDTAGAANPLLQAIEANVLDSSALALDIYPTTAPTHSATQENLAYLIYTSGSTGLPKAVQVTRGNMLNFILAMQQLFNPTATDRLLAVTSLSFDIAVLELYLPLSVGAQVVLADETLALDGQGLMHCLQERDITMMQATPVSWKMLLAAGWQQQTPLKVLCGGEAFPGELAQALLQQSSLEVWNMYGPTETTVWSAAYPLKPELATRYQQVPVGAAIANTQIHILDAHLNPVPQGVTGELCIAGDGVVRGYQGQPELTAQRFVETSLGRVYRTGDLARMVTNADGEGQIECLGRMDQQVKVRGYRIELGEIESSLAQHPDIERCCVTLSQHNGHQQLLAFVVLQETTEDSSDWRDSKTLPPQTTLMLSEYLKQQLPEYMLPAMYAAVPDLPLTPNGKVDRNALASIANQSVMAALAQKAEAYVAPSTEVETQLCEIWQDLLGVPKVGIHDNFFELGGHSLLAAQMRAAIERVFNKDIALIDMFSQQTVASLGALIERTEEQFKAEDMDWMNDLMDEMEDES